MKLIVMPSEAVVFVGIALACLCVAGAIIVVALHLHEKVTKRISHCVVQHNILFCYEHIFI